MNRLRVVLVLVTSVSLWACSSVQDDWNKARAADSIAAYQQFLSKHPTGEHSVEAGDRIHSLQDDAAWSLAKQTNSLEGYRDYLQKQPTGSHVSDAQDAVTAQQRAADWKAAEGTGTVASLQDFLKKYPAGSEAEQARAKLSDLTGYAVKLAAAKTEQQAQKEQQHLRAKFGKLLHDVVVAPGAAGKAYTVESAPMSQTEATSACGELKKAHQSCEIVRNETGKS